MPSLDHYSLVTLLASAEHKNVEKYQWNQQDSTICKDFHLSTPGISKNEIK